jgi:hypothetical protein
MIPPLLPYPRYLLQELVAIAPKRRVDQRLEQLIGQHYKDTWAGYQEEGSTHRDHNINTNFDTVEVSGKYDQTVRAAINIVAQELFDEGLIRPQDAHQFSVLLRVVDPTDRLIIKQRKPSHIDWIAEQCSQEEFAAFADWTSLVQRISASSHSWMPLFEQTEHRISEGIGAARSGRTSKSVMSLFVSSKRARKPKLEDLNDSQPDWVDLFRYELPHLGSNAEAPNLVARPVSMSQLSTRDFRGSRPHTIAALPPSLAKLLGLNRDASDFFGLRFGDELVVRSTEWQEGLDQGRRRHLPLSAGFLLEMKRSFLEEWINASGLRLWTSLGVERSITQYREESQMDWEENADVVEVKLDR